MIVFRLPGETALPQELWLFVGIDQNGNRVERTWLGGSMPWMEAHWDHMVEADLRFRCTLQHLMETRDALRDLPVIVAEGRNHPTWDPQEDHCFFCKTTSSPTPFRIQARSISEAIIDISRRWPDAGIDFCIDEDSFNQTIDRMKAALDHPQWLGIDADLRNAHRPMVEIERTRLFIGQEAA